MGRRAACPHATHAVEARIGPHTRRSSSQPAILPCLQPATALVSLSGNYLGSILSHMDHYSRPLNGIFQALADPTRRAVLGRLARGPTSISDLARPFDMALPSFMKHIHVLEKCGLIRTRKEGRVRTCAIEQEAFAAVEDWLAAQRAIWEARTDRLEQFVTTDHDEEET